MKKLVEKCKNIKGLKIYFTLFKLYKDYLLLISDKEEMGIGSVTLGVPPTIDGFKSSSTSRAYFGLNQRLLSTIIVEKSSYILKAPVLLLLFLSGKRKEEDFVKPIMDILNEIFDELK